MNPAADRLVGDIDPPLRKKVLNVPVAEGKTAVKPDGILDYVRRKAMPMIG